MLVNSQPVCLPPVGIFKPVMLIWNICFLQFEWHVCELAWCSLVHDHYKQTFDIFWAQWKNPGSAGGSSARSMRASALVFPPFPPLQRPVTQANSFWNRGTRKIWHGQLANRPRSIYQYSSMAPRLSGQNCKFFKFLLSPNSQKRLRYKENNTKYRSLTWKPRSYVRILIYRTWPIPSVRRARKESWNLHSSSRAFVLMNTATMIHCKHFSEI